MDAPGTSAAGALAVVGAGVMLTTLLLWAVSGLVVRRVRQSQPTPAPGDGSRTTEAQPWWSRPRSLVVWGVAGIVLLVVTFLAQSLVARLLLFLLAVGALGNLVTGGISLLLLRRRESRPVPMDGASN